MAGASVRELSWFDIVPAAMYVGAVFALVRSRMNLEAAARERRLAESIHRVLQAQLSDYQTLVETCLAEGLPPAVFMARLRVASADQRADFERRLAAEMEAEE